jgi:pimeloyl-ACP methyl ester carboxylesterase
MMRPGTWLAAFAVLLAAASAAPAGDARLVSIATPRGVSQAFILIRPDKPVAAVILFAGGFGNLGLKNASSMHWGAGNFLVRTRDMFAAHGFMVAVVDAPSDHKKGMSAGFRISRSHAGDIGAVAAYLKNQAPVPVWLVGNSMGTISAAAGAIAGKADGLVLTSTITHLSARSNIAESKPRGVADMALSRVRVPTLILAHRHDGCASSPPSGAAVLERRLRSAKKVELVMLDGGLPPRSQACEAKAQHGYYGIEEKAVAAIAAFIKANSK